MNQKTETLQDVAERIIRDATPATASGATCFVPRYQIDQLRAAIQNDRARELKEEFKALTIGRPDPDSDWPTREMVAAGTLGGLVTPNQASTIFQMMMLAAPGARQANIRPTFQGIPLVVDQDLSGRTVSGTFPAQFSFDVMAELKNLDKIAAAIGGTPEIGEHYDLEALSLVSRMRQDKSKEV